jgi:hypothetical protein
MSDNSGSRTDGDVAHWLIGMPQKKFWVLLLWLPCMSVGTMMLGKLITALIGTNSIVNPTD